MRQNSDGGPGSSAFSMRSVGRKVALWDTPNPTGDHKMLVFGGSFVAI